MRTMLKRPALPLLVLVIMALAAPAIGVGARIIEEGATLVSTAEQELTGNITHVANIPMPGAPNTGGSDIEFQSMEVVKLSGGATGDPLCVQDAQGACRVENGEIVFQTEVRDFAFVGRLRAESWVVDITDPRNPVKVGDIPCRLYQNDLQVRGTLLIAAADSTSSCTNANGANVSFAGIATVDISDPRNPRYLGRLQEGRGAHNVTLHPTEPLAYISNSDQTGDGRVHIVDVSNPTSPTRVTDWVYQPVESPHDITFSADGSRAYLAARTFTHIVNTENPRAPVMITTIPHAGYLSHQADPTPDGKYLMVSEELGGGGVPTASPGGPMYVWDIRDETRPVFLGAFGNDETGANGISTSHVFRINPDGFTMGIAWYNDGAGIIDFSSIRGLNADGSANALGVGPRVLAWAKMPNADVWSAKMWQERHPGFLFANDINRGLDVFYAADLGPGFIAQGSLGVGSRTNFAADTGITRQEWEADCDLTPETQGVDGWVFRLPDGYGDGQHEIAVKGQSPAPYDLDVYYYDENCFLVGEDESAGADESGPVAEGAVYAMVTSYTEGGLLRFRVTDA